MFLLSLYFTPSTWIFHSISYLTSLIFIPLFTFNFNFFFNICKFIKPFTFVNLFEGIVVNIANAIQTGFHTFCQGEFFKFIQFLPIFKILGPLIQILSENAVKAVYHLISLLLPKRLPHFQVQLLKRLSLLPENLLFFTSILTIKGLMFPISQRYCVQFPWLSWKTSSVCFWQNGVAAAIQDCWKTASIK